MGKEDQSMEAIPPGIPLCDQMGPTLRKKREGWATPGRGSADEIRT